MSFLKALFLIISAALIGFGWMMKVEIISTSGAILYLAISLVDLAYLIKESKKYRNGTWEDKKESQNLMQHFNQILGGIIVIAGLAATAISEVSLFNTPGMIIWIGSILIYVVFGIVIQLITNLPLKIGYGGWFISRSRKRKK